MSLVKQLKRQRLQTLARDLSGRDKTVLELTQDEVYTDMRKVYVKDFEELGILKNIPASEVERWAALKAATAHEAAHLRYSSKRAVQKIRKDPVAMNLTNAIEDGRIERAISQRFPGTKKWLDFLNYYIIQHQDFNSKDPLRRFLLGVAAYATTGQFIDTPEKHLVQLSAEYIDSARNAPTTAGAVKAARQILEIPQVKNLVEQYKCNLPDVEIQMPGTSQPEKALPVKPKKKPVKSKEKVEEKDGEKSVSEESKPSEKEGSTSEESAFSEKKDSASEESASSEKEGPVFEENAPSEEDSASEEELASEEDSASEKEPAFEADELLEEAPGKEENLSQGAVLPEFGGAGSPGEPLSILEEAEKELQALKRRLIFSGEITLEDIAREYAKDIHADVPFKERKFNTPDREEDFPQTKGIINRLAREMVNIIQSKHTRYVPSRRGSLNPGGLHKISCANLEVFRKKDIFPKSDLAVYLLIDCSGSMWGTKIYQTQRASWIIIQALNKINIPVAASGFTTYRSAVIHCRIKNFDSPKTYCNQIGAFQENRDGFSIRVAARELEMRKEKGKLLIVLSDGLPNHTWVKGTVAFYYKEEAYSDTAQAVREAMKNISVLGVHFGSHYELKAAKKIYPHLIHINDAVHLPVVLGKSIKKALGG